MMDIVGLKSRTKAMLCVTSLVIFLCIIILIISDLFSIKAFASSENKYGMLVANEKGEYIFYDWNDGKGIEKSPQGNIMVPLKKLTDLMSQISYSYNKNTQKATITNKVTGKKVVFTKNSKNAYYYSAPKGKGKKQQLVYKMYVSMDNASVMIPMSAIRWVLKSTGGYHYYNVMEMQTAGYDTSIYSGLIVYQPYKKISAIPKATTVNGISKTVRVTIPEGYSQAQVFQLLVNKGVVSSVESLNKVSEEYDYSYYPLIAQLKEDADRCFRLEGYLYPDTYEFYRLSKPQDAIGKFLRNGEAKISQADRDRAESLGYTMDEILTIASLIEKEIGDNTQKAIVSSIIHNRLSQNMRLQLDASINYVEKYIKPYITGDKEYYNLYYNTYKRLALPPGPICNPGKSSIQAALYPETTEYLYFASDKDGKYYYAKTYEEHKGNLN